MKEIKPPSEYKREAKRNRDLYLKHRQKGYELKQKVYNLEKTISRMEIELELAWTVVRKWNNYGLDAKGKIRSNGEKNGTCGPIGFNNG